MSSILTLENSATPFQQQKKLEFTSPEYRSKTAQAPEDGPDGALGSRLDGAGAVADSGATNNKSSDDERPQVGGINAQIAGQWDPRPEFKSLYEY